MSVSEPDPSLEKALGYALVFCQAYRCMVGTVNCGWCAFGVTLFTQPTRTGHLILFEDEHLSHSGIISGGQAVEIQTARDLLAGLVSTIPIRRLRPIPIIARRLMP